MTCERQVASGCLSGQQLRRIAEHQKREQKDCFALILTEIAKDCARWYKTRTGREATGNHLLGRDIIIALFRC